MMNNKMQKESVNHDEVSFFQRIVDFVTMRDRSQDNTNKEGDMNMTTETAVATKFVVIAEVRWVKTGRGGKVKRAIFSPFCIVPEEGWKETVKELNKQNKNTSFNYDRMPQQIPFVTDVSELVKARQAQKTEDARAAALKRLKPDELRALGLFAEAEAKEKALKAKADEKAENKTDTETAENTESEEADDEVEADFDIADEDEAEIENNGSEPFA